MTTYILVALSILILISIVYGISRLTLLTRLNRDQIQVTEELAKIVLVSHVRGLRNSWSILEICLESAEKLEMYEQCAIIKQSMDEIKKELEALK